MLPLVDQVGQQKSYIFKSSDIQDLKQHIDTDQKVKGSALALIDFDDTMAMTGHATAQHLGGLKWRDKLRKTIEALKQAKEMNADAPLFEYLTLFIAKTVQVQPVDPDLMPIIRQLEEKGFQVMVFTARGRDGQNAWYKLTINGIDELTEEQMHNAGIRLSSSHQLPLHEKIYKGSMIFCQNTPKEAVLSDLLGKNVIVPQEIRQLIMIDDKEDPIQKGKKIADTYQIPFVGFHYTAVESREEKEFDLLKSTIQMIHLFTSGKFLSQKEVDIAANQAANDAPDEYFKKTVKELHDFFMEHQLYKSYATPQELHQTVSRVAREHFKTELTVRDV